VFTNGSNIYREVPGRFNNRPMEVVQGIGPLDWAHHKSNVVKNLERWLRSAADPQEKLIVSKTKNPA